MKRASIDLGSNTCLLLIQERAGDSYRTLHDESQVVRLGEGVGTTGYLAPAAMERAEACLSSYAEILKSHGIDLKQVVAVATAQARDTKNSGEFFSNIQSKLGLKFRVLSGEEEARATFLGALSRDLHPNEVLVMDIGGGSTELVALSELNGPLMGKSLNFGAVKISERFFKSDPVTDTEFWAAESFINEELTQMKALRQTLKDKGILKPKFVAVAGTAVTLAMLNLAQKKFISDLIDGQILSRGDAHRWVEELKWRSIEERMGLPGMEAKRADVILAGALIFWRVMEELDFKEAIISTRGLRYGVFDL